MKYKKQPESGYTFLVDIWEATGQHCRIYVLNSGKGWVSVCNKRGVQPIQVTQKQVHSDNGCYEVVVSNQGHRFELEELHEITWEDKK